MINGNYVGYATNCSGSEEIQYEAVEVLDHMQVIEHVPVGYRVSFVASRVRLIGANAGLNGSLRGQMNAFPKLGADDEELLTRTLDLDDLVCTIEDSRSNLKFMQLEQVKIASRSWSISPRGIVGEDITFVAVRALDEAEAVA